MQSADKAPIVMKVDTEEEIGWWGRLPTLLTVFIGIFGLLFRYENL